MSGEPTLMDEAARAGWLYYVAGMTQDQIATELGVSRQRAQRLVSKAMAEGLVKVRLDHKIGRCLELEAGLIRQFGLQPLCLADGSSFEYISDDDAHQQLRPFLTHRRQPLAKTGNTGDGICHTGREVDLGGNVVRIGK